MIFRIMLPWAMAGSMVFGQDFRLASLFTDHGVLQRETPVPIWGWAKPGQKVVVRFAGQVSEATAKADGSWRVDLKPLAINREGTDLVVVAGSESKTLKNVVVGDVWLCGGQSNMEWGLGGCDDQPTVDAANHPLIRHFSATLNFSSHPLKETRGNWQPLTRNLAPFVSAVGYHFARRIHQETDIPIGILQSCVGGTNIELWLGEKTLLETPALATYAKTMRDSLKQYDADLKKKLPDIEAWAREARQATDGGRMSPRPPAWPEFPFGERIARPRCVTLHNGMIEPLIPYQIKGALWYQGESNANGPEAAKLYVEEQKALVTDWARYFTAGDLPFYQVQLAAWGNPSEDPALFDSWGMLREAQRKSLAAIPTAGMAVAIDIGDANDIHPRNKADVGERLARWALAKNYGRPMVFSGPLFKELKIDGNRAVITFDHVGGGLMVGKKSGTKPVTEDPAAPLKKFAMRGKEGKWHWANAVIDGKSVVCTHPDVPNPIAIRYAVSINPAGANLYNRDGLPASPFSSEDW